MHPAHSKLLFDPGRRGLLPDHAAARGFVPRNGYTGIASPDDFGAAFEARSGPMVLSTVQFHRFSRAPRREDTRSIFPKRPVGARDRVRVRSPRSSARHPKKKDTRPARRTPLHRPSPFPGKASAGRSDASAVRIAWSLFLIRYCAVASISILDILGREGGRGRAAVDDRPEEDRPR